jgi:hypothetical protein
MLSVRPGMRACVKHRACAYVGAYMHASTCAPVSMQRSMHVCTCASVCVLCACMLTRDVCLPCIALSKLANALVQRADVLRLALLGV